MDTFERGTKGVSIKDIKQNQTESKVLIFIKNLWYTTAVPQTP
jgi:hypothetical protein